MANTSAIAPFYAPYPNSYKRFVAQSWAPTAIGWSYDNRTAGFRIVGLGNSLRIECRIPGADCNPYLAYAATIAAGLDGIENRIEPPDIFQGDVYSAAHLPKVPLTLRHSLWAVRCLTTTFTSFAPSSANLMKPSPTGNANDILSGPDHSLFRGGAHNALTR
jgi:glutamine synthetase